MAPVRGVAAAQSRSRAAKFVVDGRSPCPVRRAHRECIDVGGGVQLSFVNVFSRGGFWIRVANGGFQASGHVNADTEPVGLPVPG